LCLVRLRLFPQISLASFGEGAFRCIMGRWGERFSPSSADWWWKVLSRPLQRNRLSLRRFRAALDCRLPPFLPLSWRTPICIRTDGASITPSFFFQAKILACRLYVVPSSRISLFADGCIFLFFFLLLRFLSPSAYFLSSGYLSPFNERPDLILPNDRDLLDAVFPP